MRWKGRRQSSNIEDVRGRSSSRSRSSGRNPFGRGGIRLPSRRGGVGRGGMSFKSILLIGVVFLGLWAFGLVSPSDVLTQMGGAPTSNFEQTTTQTRQPSQSSDEMTQFIPSRF